MRVQCRGGGGFGQFLKFRGGRLRSFQDPEGMRIYDIFQGGSDPQGHYLSEYNQIYVLEFQHSELLARQYLPKSIHRLVIFF